MLKLKNVYKDYGLGDNIVKALENVNLEFRENEFVSILGPSGCGKTTLLNLIGGLDRYTKGDLLINDKSTKDFKDNDWDSYRNNTIGFIFQNYNLIPHQTVLGNVEIALTLSGVTPQERKKRAVEALHNVGLQDQINKKPNQLSGGQMQRVAIARALVNNPKVLLADEPTGALDTSTSEQIMQLLKEIAKDRLIIMVTHNNELANQYSTRIVKLLDGEVVSDTMPYDSENSVADNKQKYVGGRKSSMSFFTALKLSFNNLRTKKARTIITAIAGSIGIIGIALVLAIGSGMNNYIAGMQSDTLSGFPIIIEKYAMGDLMSFEGNQQFDEFIDDNAVFPYDNRDSYHNNKITDDYIEYLENMDENLYNSFSYTYGVNMNMVTKTTANEYKSANTNLQQIPANKDFVDSQYDYLAGHYPENSSQGVLVVDAHNRVGVDLLNELGIAYDKDQSLVFEDFIGRTLKIIKNNVYYNYDNQTQTYSEGTDFQTLYNDESNISLTIVGVLRIKEKATSSYLSRGIAYHHGLIEDLISDSYNSDIVLAQKNSPERNVLTGFSFITQEQYQQQLIELGGNITPVMIQIFPKTFKTKEDIKEYLNTYNEGLSDEDKIISTDLAEMIAKTMTTMIDTISLILTAFAAISLVVSSIMIGIITYVSVVERTREIGILRSIGARKKDISRVFNAETVIIGFIAGIIGVGITLLLSIPINIIVNNKVGVSGIAALPILSAIILVTVSVTLTFIAGLIPSRIAAKKDPVVALRTE